jgi:hypothetical protein
MGKTNEQSCGNSASIHTVDYQETTQKINTENKYLGASAEADTPKVKSSTDYSQMHLKKPGRHTQNVCGGNNKLSAFKAWNARIKQGVKPETMLEGVKRYAAFMASEERSVNGSTSSCDVLPGRINISMNRGWSDIQQNKVPRWDRGFLVRKV